MLNYYVPESKFGNVHINNKILSAYKWKILLLLLYKQEWHRTAPEKALIWPKKPEAGLRERERFQEQKAGAASGAAGRGAGKESVRQSGRQSGLPAPPACRGKDGKDGLTTLWRTPRVCSSTAEVSRLLDCTNWQKFDRPHLKAVNFIFSQ